MEELKIFLMGRFEMLYNGHRIDDKLGKSKKGSLLLQYLLLRRGEPVPYRELYEVLWPNEESANPENALKTMVSRMRVMLGKCGPHLQDCIATSRGAYQWVMPENCTVDMYDFEEQCRQLEGADQLTPEIRQQFAETLNLYQGELLPENYEEESWISAQGVQLQNKYIGLARQYLALLDSVGDNEEIIRVCRMALEVNAFDERLHLILMNALVSTNRSNDALMQYKHVTNLHQRYLGTQPPEGIQEFYRKIIQAGKGLDGDLDFIRNELQTYNHAKGPFICEYSVFKEIYNLQLRALERSEAMIFLGLLMVSGADGQAMDPMKLDDVMKLLLDVLKNGLRKGDTVTHYTASQYALLLPMRAYEDGRMVMERIKHAFYKEYVNSSVVLNYRIAPISAQIYEGKISDK